MSSFCPSSSVVTLTGFPYQPLQVLEGCGVSVLVSDVDVDVNVNSGLDWGVLVLLLLSSCSFTSFSFCKSLIH